MTDKPDSEQSRLRNLKRALREFDRLANELDIPRDVRSDGTSLYRQVRREGKLPGRSVEEIVTATLYLACRDNRVPRSPDEFAAHTEYGRTRILRGVTFVEESMNLDIPPASPHIYVDKIGNELDLEQATVEQAEELIDAAEDKGVFSGISPTSAAAGAIYAAGRLTGEKPTQESVSDAADVSEVTIRNRYREILDARSTAESDGDS